MLGYRPSGPDPELGHPAPGSIPAFVDGYLARILHRQAIVIKRQRGPSAIEAKMRRPTPGSIHPLEPVDTAGVHGGQGLSLRSPRHGSLAAPDETS